MTTMDKRDSQNNLLKKAKKKLIFFLAFFSALPEINKDKIKLGFKKKDLFFLKEAKKKQKTSRIFSLRVILPFAKNNI